MVFSGFNLFNNTMKLVPHMKGGAAHLIDERQLIQLQQEQAQKALQVPEGHSTKVNLRANVGPSDGVSKAS